MKKFTLFSLLFFSFNLFGQATVNITPNKDNSMYENLPNNSNGTGELFSGLICAGGGGPRRALIQFDIASNVPAGATITAVSLELTQSNGGSGAGNDDYSLHLLTEDWGEGTSFGTGQGSAATAGDATWNENFFGTSNWGTAGGVFNGTPSATTTLSAMNTTYTWSSAGLVTDVQAWLDTPANNFGWVLIGDEVTVCTARRFGSKEVGTTPVLNVTYTCTGTVTASCQSQTIYLDAAGDATLNPADLDAGSSSSCGGNLSFSASQTSFDCSDATTGNTAKLVISGVFDGPLSGGTPKGVELFVIDDIADLSEYGISSANNGGGTTGTAEFTFPADAYAAGSYIYVASNTADFNSFFGFAPDYTSGAMSINGDDAIELFHNNAVIDVFGDVDVDGSGEPWEYLDGWANRNTSTGPDGSTFVSANWSFSGINQLEGGSTNVSCTSPFPIGTFSTAPPAGQTVTLTATDDFGQTGTCDATVYVLDTILPTVSCISSGTFMLDGTGNLTLTANDIDDGSTDNCGTLSSLTISQTTFDCTNLGTNLITLYAEDVSGNVDSCTASIDIQDSGGLDVTVDAMDSTSCFGSTDGGISITVSGGTSPYTYDWDNDGTGDFDDLEDLTNLAAGTYTVNVNDDVGCTTQEIVEVLSPAEIVPSFLNTNPSCPADADGAIDMTVSGGVGALTYDWDNDGTGDNDDTEDLTGLVAGTYTIIITDADGCSSNNSTDVLDGVNPILTVTVDGDSLFADPANSAFQWVNCPGFDLISGATSNAFQASANGDYAVILTSATGCVDTSACTTVSEVGFESNDLLKVLIYPNPAEDFITIQLSSNKVGEVWIYDVSGAVHRNKLISSQQIQLDASDLDPGAYFVEIRTTEGAVVKHLIVR